MNSNTLLFVTNPGHAVAHAAFAVPDGLQSQALGAVCQHELMCR